MPDDANDKSSEIDLGLLPGLVGYQLRRAQIETFQHFTSNLSDEGMRPGWFGLLIIVANNPGLSQTQLARTLGVDGSTMVAMIDRMEKNDWVARARSKTDRRSHELHLTDAGAETLERITPMVRDHDEAISANLTESESAELLRLLRKVTGI
ncbi:MAG: MarR family transcriptional regulator [Rhodospirillaceae bacterium]|nr:MarR family transcriptional regulator [Rhodospirillaceae bacterium]MBT3810703.1 MarR family transcriptional regulator [Rhodospirillaceae bacterium]MBT3930713.1 MarR family transcriptional regulator [Rhodospirillaceae bacterium]MBT4773250.1 MarR family transcriptional regulator [Rhodospirillaceae bacterium]MBT5356959.1 MarR family transcriptional regulator [Rhodospirillaceae bacterium]